MLINILGREETIVDYRHFLLRPSYRFSNTESSPIIMLTMQFDDSIDFARYADDNDYLRSFRTRFLFPRQENGEDFVYLTGNSLGLQPRSTRDFIDQELNDWAQFGVEGHFKAKNPWMPYHELVTTQMAEVVGAKPIEVVVMNSLTVNLHLLMVSFYCPSRTRYKVIIEAGAFPSDQYAVKSQINFHSQIRSELQNEHNSKTGENESLIELKPRAGEHTLRTDDVIAKIEQNADSLSLIMLGGVNYYTGQAFDIQAITEAGHRVGAKVGFDLAHAAGNLRLQLHNWDVDFAAWCSYKYLNSGPGGIGGIFVHERYADDFTLPRFAGWWGNDKATRFLMKDEFQPLRGAEGWQLSNPPIFQLASLRASLEIFAEAGMQNLRSKSINLTAYLEFLVTKIDSGQIEIITPKEASERGCQLSIKVRNADREIFEEIRARGVIADWREPDVIRIAPVPLYNSFEDVWKFAEILRSSLANK